MICRDFFLGGDDSVDEFVLLENQLFSGLVHWEAGRPAVFINQQKPILCLTGCRALSMEGAIPSTNALVYFFGRITHISADYIYAANLNRK